MSILADIAAIAQPGYGWVVAVLYLAYQLYAPRYLGRQTVLAPIIEEVPEQVEELREKQDDLREDVTNVQEGQETMMQVQRAQARANEKMDHNRVDEYLLENGVRPNEFLNNDKEESDWRADGGTPTEEMTDSNRNDGERDGVVSTDE